MTGSSTGEGFGAAIKKGVGMVHGTGEAIRGNFNAAVDSATGDRQSAQRQQNIASRGVDEFEHGHYHGTGAGVTPVDTDRERVNRAVQGESATVGSTNYGPHGTNIGNKLDPRFDSDNDHRGPVTGSTNAGPHSTNIGNRVDPRVDDDYPATQYDGSIEPSEPSHYDNCCRSTDDYLATRHGASPDRIELSALTSSTPQKDYRELPSDSYHYPPSALDFGMSAAETIVRKPTEPLSSLKTFKKESWPESKHARRSSADADTSRADTFTAPKRSGTEPHIALNNLFGAIPARAPQDDEKGSLRLSDRGSNRGPKQSPDYTSDSDVSTDEEGEREARTPATKRMYEPDAEEGDEAWRTKVSKAQKPQGCSKYTCP